jgi:hypothetical protein
MVAELDRLAGRLASRRQRRRHRQGADQPRAQALFRPTHDRDILANPPDLFERVGLGRLLTPRPRHGLYAMVERIRQLARAYQAAPAEG